MKRNACFASVLLAFLLMILALGCDNQSNALKGKWSYNDGVNTIWDFKADGNLLVTYGETKLELKYTLVDADTVRISGMPNEDSSADVDFVINGDKMVMTIVDGSDSQEFTRVK